MGGKFDLNLSANIMQMQFMRPAKLAMEEKRKRENLAKIEEDYYGKQIPSASQDGKQGKFVFCPDIGYTQLLNLKFGRFSFNGANPEIEKMMNEETGQRKRLLDPTYNSDDEKDIKDEEMMESSFGRRLKKPKADVLQIFTEESGSALLEEDTVKRIIETEDGEMDNSDSIAPLRPTEKFHPYKRSRGGRGRGKRGRN